ncbi:Arm DNA-binding domain-containing protein [Mesosutterella sp. OilRF-GAM-744-9]|uniref:Arm DNA-binding domain-containing protein n=1 Tax=Mesosutterella porci TaxID=2915351 RepID=A0ABS9MRV0_9BURK|nr:Arm DNA-binding domain-containing protein [Mesosutterella sp. oilRF-744-WT-GAM-9]
MSKTGARSFRYNYLFAGRQETVTLGLYPVVTHAQAREKLLDAKRCLQEGKSPAREKKAAALRKKAEHSIADEINEWMDAAPMAESTRKARRYVVNRVILPVLAALHISKLTDQDIRRAIGPFIESAPATALTARDILRRSSEPAQHCLAQRESHSEALLYGIR